MRGFRHLILALSAIGVFVLAGCGGGGVQTHLLTPASTPSPTASASAAFTQENTAIDNVQNLYSALPHTSLSADLTALAAQMVSSGAYTTATVDDGGISAVLADGQPVEIFADSIDSSGALSSSIRRDTSAQLRRTTAALGSPTNHEVAFLINTQAGGAFVPSRQVDFTQAFSASGFTPVNSSNVDDLDVSLDNIVALGAGRPIDFLDIATHGKLGTIAQQTPNPAGGTTITRVGQGYIFASTTPRTAANAALYADDIAAGRVQVGIILSSLTSTTPTNHAILGFTPDFLTTHLKFNPGAVVDNQSCYGQDSFVATAVQNSFKAAGVGRYFGWTGGVVGNLADGTDAYLFDQLLGEQSPSITHLDAYISQKTPPQPPLTLDAIETAMSTTMRSGPFWDQTKASLPALTYTQSRTFAGSIPVTFVFSDFGGENLANPPIEYGLPSIDHIDVTAGILTVTGTFPKVAGFVNVTDGANVSKLTPATWATDHVTVNLQLTGTTKGNVQVLNHDGIGGNSVPIVAVLPAQSNVANGATQTLTASPAATPVTLYHWKLIPNPTVGHAPIGQISDGTNSGEFDSKSAIVTYRAPNSGDSFDRVTVEAFDTTGGGRRSLGTSFADLGIGCVKFTSAGLRLRQGTQSCLLGVAINPAQSSVQNGMSETLTAGISPLPSNLASLTYHWFIGGGPSGAPIGHITGGGTDNFTTPSTSVTYTAPASVVGTDQVNVEVFDNSTNPPTSRGTAIASIVVYPPLGPAPTNLDQSRCAGLSVSPHQVSVGGSVTATVSSAGPLACGGDIPPMTPPTWTWNDGGGLSACAANSLSCTIPGTRSTGGWAVVCLAGSSRQGPWDSCDYYAVTP